MHFAHERYIKIFENDGYECEDKSLIVGEFPFRGLDGSHGSPTTLAVAARPS